MHHPTRQFKNITNTGSQRPGVRWKCFFPCFFVFQGRLLSAFPGQRFGAADPPADVWSWMLLLFGLLTSGDWGGALTQCSLNYDDHYMNVAAFRKSANSGWVLLDESYLDVVCAPIAVTQYITTDCNQNVHDIAQKGDRWPKEHMKKVWKGRRCSLSPFDTENRQTFNINARYLPIHNLL